MVGKIERGFAVLVGFTHDDDESRVRWMAEKINGLRVFPDDDGKMNRSLADVGGGVLVVSQFTLYGDVQRGRRPSFVHAAGPDVAVPLYEQLISDLRGHGLTVETGEFGAMMTVDLVNEGPVTLIIDR